MRILSHIERPTSLAVRPEFEPAGGVEALQTDCEKHELDEQYLVDNGRTKVTTDTSSAGGDVFAIENRWAPILVRLHGLNDPNASFSVLQPAGEERTEATWADKMMGPSMFLKV